ISREHRFAGVMPEVGTYIIARHQVYGYQAFQFSKCSNINIENITIYSNPGMGLTGRDSRDFNIQHLRVMIRPGSGRWMSSAADATHFSRCRGDLVMENCLFESMGDDATNINAGHFVAVTERLDDRRIRIGSGNRGRTPPAPEVGDRLELSGRERKLETYATMTVASAEKDEGKNTLTVTFEEELPQRTREGDIIGNTSACPNVLIRNCMVIRNRARGFLIKTRGALIEDCYFQDITASAVLMNADITTWWESIGSHDVIIRNNHFVDCRYDPDVVRGVIECLTNPSGESAPAGVHHNITIENNIIQGSNANAIKIGSADGVVIEQNIIDQSRDDAILIYNSRNVRIGSNQVTNCDVPLTIGEGCDTATIFVENNKGF
ncbi:MAG: right-handed parallel beta-helix repeat-containing protein, partial [Bacteroidales bacterium]|nr:right-handed parallel beta-helix repeat-containing protein [Bacteroidales bacterium]